MEVEENDYHMEYDSDDELKMMTTMNISQAQIDLRF